MAHLEQIISRHSAALPRDRRRLQAFGLYLLLRFNRSVRVQYAALLGRDDDDSRGEDLGTRKHPQLFVGADRPLEFGYLQTRMFGGLSGVKGFNFIMRGGLLPRTTGGHTMAIRGRPGVGKTSVALHLMADMAARGRFAAYVSLEEGSETVRDKLLAFNIVDFDRYDIIDLFEDPGLRIREAYKSGRGVLLLCTVGRAGIGDIEQVVASIGFMLSGLRRYQWRAVAIDSIDALHLPVVGDAASGRDGMRRESIKRILEALDNEKFWGLLVGEVGDRFKELEYLVDTMVEVGREGLAGRRFFSVTKSRLQRSHGGQHTLAIREGRGIRLYPSLAAVQSACRRRVRATPSVERGVPMPPSCSVPGLEIMPEKSSLLIMGPPGAGKTELLLTLASSATVSLRTKAVDDDVSYEVSPQATLVVTFRTPELAVQSFIRSRRSLHSAWSRIASPNVRWYSPGSQLDSSHLVDDLREIIRESRRDGSPISRVVFDEIEAIPHMLPGLREDAMLWPTVLFLLGTEAITTLCAASVPGCDQRLLESLAMSCDYAIELGGAATRVNRLVRAPNG